MGSEKVVRYILALLKAHLTRHLMFSFLSFVTNVYFTIYKLVESGFRGIVFGPSFCQTLTFPLPERERNTQKMTHVSSEGAFFPPLKSYQLFRLEIVLLSEDGTQNIRQI